MRHRRWTDAEERLLSARYADTPIPELTALLGRSAEKIHQKAHRMEIYRSDEFLRGPHGNRMRAGSKIGESYRFHKGHIPANKGLRRPGWAPGRMSDTQFKAGDRPVTWVPIGTRRIEPDGYEKIKVTDSRQPARKNWEYVHVRAWVAAHGTVPPSHAVVFRDGNKKNCALENLELISRQELMRRNSVHRLPKALAQVVQLKGALQHRINNRRNSDEESH